MTADGQSSREQMYQHVQMKHVKSLTGLIRAFPTIISVAEKEEKIKKVTAFLFQLSKAKKVSNIFFICPPLLSELVA